MFILRERERASRGRAEREETESEAGFKLRAVSTEPDTAQTHEL